MYQKVCSSVIKTVLQALQEKFVEVEPVACFLTSLSRYLSSTLYPSPTHNVTMHHRTTKQALPLPRSSHLRTFHLQSPIPSLILSAHPTSSHKATTESSQSLTSTTTYPPNPSNYHTPPIFSPSNPPFQKPLTAHLPSPFLPRSGMCFLSAQKCGVELKSWLRKPAHRTCQDECGKRTPLAVRAGSASSVCP